jgi:phage major head subunit gpT-like protein
MPPALSSAFPDLLDSRFAKIFNDRYKQLPDMIAEFFTIVSGSDAPTKDTYRTSSVGTFGDIGEFSGTVTYDDVYQGYDATITPKEYASGFQIQRKLFDDDLYGVMDGKPKGLATAVQRTRQKHGAQLFNNAFSLDTTWNSFTENVPLCSNSHTTTSGASTATGFDNLATTALSATALAAARIQMVNFRGDRAERISIKPDLILYPPDLYQQAFEIVESLGLPDTPNNNRNVHEGQYKLVEWNYLTDTNNWFLIDQVMMKDALYWVDRVTAEFAMVEEFDTLVGKWRVYERYGQGHNEWRFVLGSQVT